MTKIDLLIPARNEERALPPLLKEIDRGFLNRIILVDNGSTDRTAEIARRHGCYVVSCPVPGYGNACLAGIDFASKEPPDILVFMDGDHSDYPSDIPRLCKPILHNQADLVIGSRSLGLAEVGSLTATQRFGNALATKLLHFFWKYPYTDLGPFRAVAFKELTAMKMADRNYGWTIEMQIKAVLNHLRILEIPVNYRNRIGTSKISGTLRGVIGAGYKILFTIFKYRIVAGGPRKHPLETRL